MSDEDTEAGSPNRRKSFRTYWTEDISTTNVDFLLVLISLGVGCIDGFTFPELKVFAANQTGNTVFLALAAAQVNDSFLGASRSAVSLCSFWLGAFCSGQIGHRVGNKTRWWVTFALFWQGMLVLTAAIVLWSGGITEDEIIALNNKVLGIICLLGFSYGAQGTTARGLDIPQIPTVVITSAMIDVFGDKNLFKLDNRPRNRRVAFILAIFFGAFIGGWIDHKVNGALVIGIAAAIKLLSAGLILFFNSAESQKRAKAEKKRIAT